MEQLFLDISIILVSCVALGCGANWLVDSASRLARKYGISDLVIGLTIVAFGTSAPEFAVTVSGAVSGNDDVSVANIIGSNIFNISIILGSCAMVTALACSALLIKRDTVILTAVTGLLWYMLSDLTLSRLEGIVLFSSLVAYLGYLIVKKDSSMVEEEEINHDPAKKTDWLMLIFSLVTIAAGGNTLVFGATEVARYFGLSEWVIGMTIVAAGTSMPELVVSLAAVLKKNHGISVGNLIGSNLFNIMGVLGLAVIINPMSVDKMGLATTILLVFLTVLVLVCMWTGRKVTRFEGGLIFLAGLLIMVWNFLISRPSV